MTQISAPKITAPPNGTLAYVAGVLGGIASGSSRPDGFERYYGPEGAQQLYAAFQEIDSLLVQLCNAGVGSGREVWAAFTDGKVDEPDTDDVVTRVQQVLEVLPDCEQHTYRGERMTGKTQRAVEAVAEAVLSGVENVVLVVRNERLARDVRERLADELRRRVPLLTVSQRSLERVVVPLRTAEWRLRGRRLDQVHWDLD